MSLYRKYRPQTFADVVGQDHVVTTLEQAAEQEKLAHAYLFAGSRGTGKTSVARILAKVLMINGIEDETIQKQIVKGVEEGSIVDLLEIDAASNRGIDDIRDLVEKIQFSPVVASAKVYIIDEVHMLTKEAFNALLKTLEEPPAYAFFILATTEINKIPMTIQSRCQRFPFHRIREEDIIRRLQYIADQEHVTIDREALRAIAHHVDGSMRDAISLLDQMRSLEKIGLADVEQRIGGTGHEQIMAVFSALEKQDREAIVEAVETLEEEGVPLDVFVRQLLSIVRTHLHEGVEKGESTSDVLHVFDVLLGAIRDMRVAPVPGLVLESALLSLCTSTEDTSEKGSSLFSKAKQESKKEEETSVKDEKKEKKEKKTKKEEKKKEEVSDDKEDETKEEEEEEAAAAAAAAGEDATVEAPEVSLENLKEAWPEILKETKPAPVKMSLKNGHIHAFEGNRVTVSFSSSFHRDKVAETEAARAVEDVMERIFKKSLRLECVLEQGEDDEGTPEKKVNLAEAAAEIF